ncbi:MAG: NAD(P)H-binding protein [Labilithrix sp.]|nr:NAD(P)H-binding protein [Labilithrix sp.]
MAAPSSPILVTGASGRVGGVGRSIVELLRQRGASVRAFVHHDDERAERLRSLGAEVFVGDLTRAEDVVEATRGCRRVYLGMGVSPDYLEAAVLMAAAARELDVEVLVNISQMTVSQMSLSSMTESRQQRQHWMVERVLDGSGLPVVEVRPTVFLENPFFSAFAEESIADDDTIRLPFGGGRTSPIAARDVAEVVATILESPASHVGRVYELTGPVSQDMNGVAAEYARALGRPITWVDVPFDEWSRSLRARLLPEHLESHLLTMARLHAIGRYDRSSSDVERILGRPATSVRDFVAANAARFARRPIRRETAAASPARARDYTARRIDRAFDVPYERFVRSLASLLGRMDPDALHRLRAGNADEARRELAKRVGPSGFAIFQELDHGALVRAFTDRPARSTLYVFGNALLAIEMTKHVAEVGLYVPLRMFVEEMTPTSVRVTYDLPSSILGQFGSAPVNVVARDLDRKVEALLTDAAAGKRPPPRQ